MIFQGLKAPLGQMETRRQFRECRQVGDGLIERCWRILGKFPPFFLRVMPSLGLTKVALFEQQDRMPLDQITFGLKRRGLKLVALGAIVCLAAGISLSAYAQQEPMDTRELGMMAKSQKLAALQKPSVLDECKQTLESQKKTIAALEKRVKELERELAARKAKK